MAVLEKAKTTKVMIDDTVQLVCSIDTAHAVEDHVEYNVRVHRGMASQESWVHSRRYNDFCDLEACLRISGLPVPLPPKKLLGNTDREFIQERRQKLQVMLTYILAQPLLACSVHTKRFLDMANYYMNFQELALQHISMFMRSEPGWEVVEPMPEIGWRLRKHYTLIRSTALEASQGKDKYLMSWAPLGPYATLPAKDCLAIMRLLPAFQHPYLYPIELGFSNENGGLTIRKFHDNGSVRDVICKSKPKASYLKKYVSPKAFVTFSAPDIRKYGRQLLEMLKFMQEKGIPYGHLHAGNIALSGSGSCRVLDIENFVLGQPGYYRSFVVQLKKVQTTEAMDVYGLGHVLYEMAYGQALTSPTCDALPEAGPPELRGILESILGTLACTKTGLPTVDNLLANTFFSLVVLPPPGEKPQMKVPSKLKEALKVAKQELEAILAEEQRALNLLRRRSKIKAHHMSQEEKSKRRQSQKKARELADDGQNAEASASSSLSTPAAMVAATPPAASTSKPVGSATVATTPVPAPPPLPPSLVVANGHAARPTSAPVPAAPPGERGAMLNSIAAFSKSSLRKSVTVDKSGPKL